MKNPSHNLPGLPAAAMVLGALCVFGASHASAATAADCRASWNSMKTAGTTPAGAKYNQYIHDCVSGTTAATPAQGSMPKAAAPSPAASAKVAPAPAPTAKVVPVTVAPSALPTSTPSGACTVQYDLALMMGKIPTGQSKDVFLKNCLTKSATSPTATPATVPGSPVPPEPTAATGGQAGEVTRIRACGKEWRQLKDTNKVPAGTKWPQFWSECDKQLKAQGL